jgi:ATP-dependent DNA helicase RecG
VTEGESDVLNIILQNGRVTQREIALCLGVSRKTITMRIKSLKEKSLISRIGSDAKGHWVVTFDERSIPTI